MLTINQHLRPGSQQLGLFYSEVCHERRSGSAVAAHLGAGMPRAVNHRRQAMSPEAEVYRGVIVRAVTGMRPAMIATVDDATRLESLCEQLARAERIGEMLQDQGFNPCRLPIDEAVKLLLEKP
ncbi:hypothetical protein [Massilia sp. BHUDP2]|uniref:hypothetical protein n=1 Tax=Massilia sp. BHUDP2 TaxID=3034505 RepID=UPI003905D1FB